jgi:tetratricopeptide (TPR) repeat protein
VDEAIAAYRKAIEIDPRDPVAHSNLGAALADRGKVDEAIVSYRKAIALDSRNATFHSNLGAILCDSKRDYDAAIDCFRKAIEIDPRLATAHRNLGVALKGKGKLDEAIAAFRKAIELCPKLIAAHLQLGGTLQTTGKVDEAIACYKKVIDLDPRNAHAHYNLGTGLRSKGKLDEAITAFRAAIRIDKEFAEAHCNLGFALVAKGQFKQGVEALRRGHQLGIRRDDWPHPSRLWLRQAERLARLEDRLLAVLAGKDKPKDANDCLGLASMCRQPTHNRHTAAARLYAEAFAEQPALAADLQAGHRYNAACCAALAGCGQDKDANTLDGTDRAEMRYRALAWLQDDLSAHASRLARLPPDAAEQVRRVLLQWRRGSDLAATRDPSLLARLPEAEQVAWLNLWARVDALLARTASMR